MLNNVLKTIGFTAVALPLVGAAPALSAQSGSQPGSSQTSASASSPSGSTQSKSTTGQQSSGSSQSRQHDMQAREAVTHALEQSGFTDVQFLDAAYLVQAMSPDDKRVVMFIDVPDPLVGTSQSSARSGMKSGATSSSGSKSGTSSN